MKITKPWWKFENALINGILDHLITNKTIVITKMYWSNAGQH